MPAALIVMAVAAVAATTTSVIAGNKARADQRHANDLQQQAADEQRASNAGQAAQAARQQYREDRIRRARIMQSAENTGTSQSSGELGAEGSLQSQYSTNQGNLWGGYERGVTIGNLQTEANQSMFDAQQTLSRGQNLSSIFNTVGSLAGMAYSYDAAKKTPGTTVQPAAAK